MTELFRYHTGFTVCIVGFTVYAYLHFAVTRYNAEHKMTSPTLAPGVSTTLFDITPSVTDLPERTRNNLTRRLSGTNQEKQLRTQNEASNLNIHLSFRGRLGNQLFQYSSMYVISRLTGRQATLVRKVDIRNVFSNLTLPFTWKTYQDRALAVERSFTKYSPKLIHNLPKKEHVMICCFLQSWKYFQSYEKELRQQFQFRSDIISTANIFLQRLRKKLESNTSGQNNVTFVAVHIRRARLEEPEPAAEGYLMANESYIDKAMDAFRGKYKNPHFVMASDDMDWCQQNFNYPDVTFIHNHANVDFAILSLCNHTIFTVGTFGWWAAWFAGGDVIYLDTPYRPGSPLGRKFYPKDYFLPHWTPMSN